MTVFEETTEVDCEKKNLKIWYDIKISFKNVKIWGWKKVKLGGLQQNIWNNIWIFFLSNHILICNNFS